MEKKKISFKTWKIILACTGQSNIYRKSDGVTPYKALTDYLDIKTYDKLYYPKIYDHLKKAAKDFFGEDGLIYLSLSLHYDAGFSRDRYYDEKEERKPNYCDYCNQLIGILMCPSTTIKTEAGEEDLYEVVTEDDRVLSLHEAYLEWVPQDIKEQNPQKHL